eukprot:TRINITY_DN17953_c1_g1_i1.p1 TRINITY_DN17953_c1_g1~~TRINITY_DN17953_c1_g1_i1.p1  ORF type:complete len:440 (+),score=96.27 TRINITY_DN17953_c1_g1_i1:125-1444(+)
MGSQEDSVPLCDVEAELRRRTREIAQVRDKLRQRDQEVEEWKRRHNELVKQNMDGDNDPGKLRAQRNSLKLAEEKAREACLAAQEEVVDLKRQIARGESIEVTLQERNAEGQAAAVAHMVEFEERTAVERLERSERLTVMQSNLDALRVELRETTATLASERRDRAAALSKLDIDLTSAWRELSDAEAQRDDAVRDYRHLMSRTKKLEAELEASKECGLAQSLQSFETERRVRAELDDALERIGVLERELTLAQMEAPNRLKVMEKQEAQVRILKVENAALRTEASGCRRRNRELMEALAMAGEDQNARHVEAVVEIAKLRAQIEETRRARNVEMRTLIASMSRNDDIVSSASGEAFPVNCSAAARGPVSTSVGTDPGNGAASVPTRPPWTQPLSVQALPSRRSATGVQPKVYPRQRSLGTVDCTSAAAHPPCQIVGVS